MHSSIFRRRASLLVAAFVLPLALPIAARADDPAAGEGVARISYLQGPVSVQRGDSASPIDAALNAPVLGADYLTTGQGGRAEVEFDGRTAIRLGEGAQLRFAHLDTGDREVQLAQGTIDLRVAGDVDPRTDVDTPSVTVHAVEPGSYRITVDGEGHTFVTARTGRAEIVSPQGARPLGPGSTLVADGTAANPRIDTIESVALDNFDAFCQERDARFERAVASNETYVNPNVPGVDDLNADGRWVNDGNYGQVWVPTDVQSGWAPYSDGRWAWEDSYGWTWVGYEPWGWAPYHYGRWYHSAAYGWAWCPPAAGSVAWSPALVAFFGFGGGGGISIGFGNIGWVPLAPSEAFTPWWGRRGFEGNNIAFVNNYGDFTRHYRNALVAGGITAVPHDRFVQGRFDQHVSVTRAELASVHVARGGLPIVPTAANLRYTSRVSATVAPRTTLFERSFAGSGRVATRTPFEQQRTAVATHTEYRAPAASSQRFTEQSTTRPSDPWSRFGAARGTYSRDSASTSERSTVPTYSRGNASTSERSTAPSYSRDNASTYQRSTTANSRPSYQQNATTANSRPSYQQNAAPAYSRPSYQENAAPAYSRPSYQQNAAPAYSRPSYQQNTAPAYSRPSYRQNTAPAYSRPAYQQRSAPAYQPRSAPAYQQRTAPQQAQPRSRATPSGENRHGG